MTVEDKLFQLLVAGISTGSIYVLVAVGFNVIFKSTDAINFAQGEWLMMGGMIAAFFYMSEQWPVWAACIAAIAAVALIGMVSERLTIYPMKQPTPILITLVSIGLAIASKGMVMIVLGKNPAGYPPFSGETPVMLGEVSIHPQTFWIVGIAGLFMLLAHLFFERTLLGKSMRAAAADRSAASLVGISSRRTVMWAFTIAAASGAIAGAIVTPLTFTEYDAGTFLGFKGFSAAMLGGIGNLYGAVAGGLVLGVLEALAGGYLSSQFKDAVAFLVLLLVLFVRPSGLLGRAQIERV